MRHVAGQGGKHYGGAGLAALAACALVAGFTGPAHAEPIPRERVETALPKLAEMARKAVADGGVPGLAIAVVHDDRVVFLEGYGLREMGRPETVNADTVFQLASMSKPISSTVVAAVVSEGLVDWDSRIADLDPAFRLHDAYPTQQLTVRDLFAHRSGLPGAAGNELEDIGYDRAEVMRRLRLVPPSSSFRAGYSYSNAGITEGALAAARPTGMSWEQAAEQKLYRPLGMASTSSRYADFIARANRAALHIKADGAWAAKITRDPDHQSPAGGVSSSARDLTQWMRLELASGMLDGKRLIAEDALDATHQPLMARGRNPLTGGASFYGLGWNVELDRRGVAWGHAGAFSVGGRTLVTLYPDSNIGIVVLANAFPTGVPEGLAASFFDLVFEGRVTRDWIPAWNDIYASLFGPAIDAAKKTYGTAPAPKTPALPASAYAGAYANDYLGAAKVLAEGGALRLIVGPGEGKSYALTHFDRDLFLLFPDPEMPDTPSAVRFAIGPDGKAGAMTVDFLNDVGLGTLQRVE